MHRRTLPLLVSLAAVTGLLVSACSSDGGGSTGNQGGASNSNKGTYTVGAVLPLSGPYAAVGAAELAGLKVAIGELNAKGGILGRHVNVTTRDSQSTAQRASLAAQDLIAKDHPDFILPDTISSISTAVMPLVMKAKTISSAPLTTFDDPAKYPYFFEPYFTGDQQAQAYSAAIANLWGNSSKVGILVGNDPSGQTIADGMESNLGKQQISVIGKESFEAGASDVTVQLAKLKSAGATVVFVHALGEQDLGTVMKGVQDLNWSSVKVLGDGSSITVNLVKAIPSAVASQFNVVASRIYARPSSSAVSQFITSLTANNGGTTPALEPASLMHDALLTVAWATTKAGTTNSDAVRKAMESVGTATDFPSSEMVAVKNPGYTPNSHGIASGASADYWAVMKVSPNINGTYEGTPLDLKIVQ